MRTQRIASRPAVQGSRAPIRLAHDAHGLTDSAGLLLLRQLWDRLNLGARIDARAAGLGGLYRSSLMIEVWIALLFYGGGVLDDLHRFAGRNVAPLFGWASIPDPTTFGRWLRRGGGLMVELLDDLLWYLVRARWDMVGKPESLVLILDSTVLVRYGLKQAGAEVGYNPKKHGRPSHHPLVAFTDTGDCLGVVWRSGSAHTADGAQEWLRTLINRIRRVGIASITVRMDKGFFSHDMVALLQDLGVGFLLKVPNHSWVRSCLSGYRQSQKDDRLWTATGTLYGASLYSVKRCETLQRATPPEAPPLDLDAYEEVGVAHVLTNIPGIQSLTAWRLYNAGAVIEQRIKECYQLQLGRTAIDNIPGNGTLCGLAMLAYQLLHTVRTTALTGNDKTAQPQTIRQWYFRLPAKITVHARKICVHLLRTEPMRPHLLRGLRELLNMQQPRTTVLII